MKKFMSVKDNIEEWADGVVTAHFMKFSIIKATLLPK